MSANILADVMGRENRRERKTLNMAAERRIQKPACRTPAVARGITQYDDVLFQ